MNKKNNFFLLRIANSFEEILYIDVIVICCYFFLFVKRKTFNFLSRFCFIKKKSNHLRVLSTYIHNQITDL